MENLNEYVEFRKRLTRLRRQIDEYEIFRKEIREVVRALLLKDDLANFKQKTGLSPAVYSNLRTEKHPVGDKTVIKCFIDLTEGL